MSGIILSKLRTSEEGSSESTTPELTSVKVATPQTFVLIPQSTVVTDGQSTFPPSYFTTITPPPVSDAHQAVPGEYPSPAVAIATGDGIQDTGTGQKSGIK